MMQHTGRYLITGGTGKLGRALVEKLYADGFKNLVLMARNENSLADMRESYPGIAVVSGCVSDSYSISRAAAGCDGIFHLAAYKNLVMAEKEPHACALSNITGVSNLLHVASELKPKFIVFVSSSAAADVKGVYGASKFMGERLMWEFALAYPMVLCRTVRFANLWRGAGSFILNWERAVNEGRSITVTDPRATRFFITMEAAAEELIRSLDSDAFLVTQKTKSASMAVIMAAFNSITPVKFDVVGMRAGEALHQTVDGINFSDKAEQHTIDSFKREFLCRTK